jgi:photosystem II stability/assembly factor-like uncharacterized protein
MAYVLNAEGNYFVQRTLDEVPWWLTCTGVGDVDIPQGDLTPIYCPDPLNSGQFKIEGFVRGDKGAGTYRLTKPLVGVYNMLLETICEHQGRINWVCRGNRQDPRNYELAALLVQTNPSRSGITNPAREPEGTSARVNTNADMSFIEALMLYPVTLARQAVSNTADANAVYFLPERCEDRCGGARGLCEQGAIGLDRAAGYVYDAEVKYTLNSGATWAATAIDPYAYGGNTGALIIFETLTGTRPLVFRSGVVAGAPAECAWSVDWGATWTNVQMTALLGYATNDAALRGATVYAALTGGYIVRSLNQGGLWANAEAGVETTQDLNAICFDGDDNGYCVGDSNVFLYVTPGSEDWNARTGPAVGVNLLSVAANLSGHVFVGTNDGRVFRSTDGGQNWTEWVDLNAGSITWIEFDPKAQFVGAFSHNDAAGDGHLYRSEDGGASWWEIEGMPANDGINDGFMCDQNHIYVVGNAVAADGTTFIAKTSPS